MNWQVVTETTLRRDGKHYGWWSILDEDYMPACPSCHSDFDRLYQNEVLNSLGLSS